MQKCTKKGQINNLHTKLSKTIISKIEHPKPETPKIETIFNWIKSFLFLSRKWLSKRWFVPSIMSYDYWMFGETYLVFFVRCMCLKGYCKALAKASQSSCFESFKHSQILLKVFVLYNHFDKNSFDFFKKHTKKFRLF